MTDLNSQLNPSGCKRSKFIEETCVVCGKNIEDDSLFTKICKECSGQNKLVRLATAKALYNEKKKTLEFLEICSKNLTLIDYEENDRIGLAVLRDINNTKRTLESEIKQIENEVPEVLEK